MDQKISYFLLFIVFLSALFAFSYPYYRRNRLLNCWRNSLNLDQHEAIYNRLFHPVNGFELSRRARMVHDAIDYTYGEIEFTSFIALIALTKPHKNTVFYDLGSGIGTAVLAYTLVFPFRACYGIECLPLLHQTAEQQLIKLKQIPTYCEKVTHVYFINNNFLEAELTSATLIFINATAYFGETWKKIIQFLNQVHPETIVITTSKKIISKQFQLINTTIVSMSWGAVQTYVYKKSHHGIKLLASKPIE